MMRKPSRWFCACLVLAVPVLVFGQAPSPELIGALTKELGATQEQAQGAAGAAGVGGLASLAGSFTKLGLKPELAMKAAPVLVNHVTKTGGAEVAKLLAAALK